MGVIKTTADDVYRDNNVDGQPNSPSKAEIRALFGTIDTEFSEIADGVAESLLEAQEAAETAEAAAAAVLGVVDGIVTSAGIITTTPFEIAGPGWCVFAILDGADKPFLAVGEDGSLWVMGAGGVLVQLGGTVTPVAYTGGSARRTEYNNSISGVNAQPHRNADANVYDGFYTTGQSLNGSNNDRAYFTGSISGTTLTVPGAITGEIRPLDRLFWAGIDTAIGATPTMVVAQLSSTTWEVSPSQTRASIAMESRDTARTTTATYPSDVLMSGITGQSYGLLYPNGAAIDRLVAAVELDVVYEDPANGYWKETGLVAMANRWVELNQKFLGYTPKVVLGGAPTGGTPYRGHTRGSPNRVELYRIIQAHSDILRASGKKLVVRGIRYRCGEADNADGRLALENARQLCQMVDTLNVDIKAITGQTETVRLFVNQPNRRADSIRADARTPVSVLMASDLDPRIICTGPIYWGDVSSDGAHIRSWSYLAMGTLDAHHWFDELNDVGARVQRVRKLYRTAANTYRMDFEVPVGLDTDIIDGTADDVAANAGASFQDGTGAASVSVSSVAVIGGSQATGTLTFTGAGTPGDTISINYHRITLVASGATGAQVNIGIDAAATAQNVKTYINAHALETQVTAAGAADVLTLTSRHNRSGGSIATTETSTACSFAAGTLTGGAFSYTLEFTLSGTPTGYDPRFLIAAYSAATTMGNVAGPRSRIRAGVPRGVARDDREAGGLVEIFDFTCTENVRAAA